MVKVRVRPETGALYLDFQYRSVRCREQTALPDTPGNRRAVTALAKRIDREIALGTFDYATTFPESPKARLFSPDAFDSTAADVPTLSVFAGTWVVEGQPRWRSAYRSEVRSTLDKIILPALGSRRLDQVDRATLLAFQAQIAERPGHGGKRISSRRINKIMMLLKSIINEGCERFGLQSPARTLKPLKQARSEVLPFALDEVDQLINRVREDYRPYLTVRLLTGLRTGEADGLQWDDVDFTAGFFRVERTHSRNGDGLTKTEGSRRTIPMVPQVRAALLEQRDRSLDGSPWVFHSRNGNPIDAVNFTNRVWYPLLRNLGLKQRPPYQMRHTAATLMLAAGENPEWVANMLGHSSTEMLFRVYSRYVPNLTRQDGRAFAGLLAGMEGREAVTPNAANALNEMSDEQIEQFLKTRRGNQETLPKGGNHDQQ